MRPAIVLFVLALVAFCGFGAFSVYKARTNRVEAETFLRQLGENHPEAAYASATARFREDFEWENFRQFVENLRLNSYRSDSFRIDSGETDFDWRHRSISSTELAGHGALRDGTKFRVQMKLRPEQGIWKIDYFYVTMARPRPGAKSGIDAASNSVQPALGQERSLQEEATPAPGENSPKPGIDPRNASPSPATAEAPEIPAPAPSP